MISLPLIGRLQKVEGLVKVYGLKQNSKRDEATKAFKNGSLDTQQR
jgi:hypothetical protein